VVFDENILTRPVMKKFKYLLFCVFFLSVFFSCGRIEQLPPEPYIDFTSFTVFDTTDILGNDCKGGRLKFYFEDGDGDMGLDPPENEDDTDTTNLFFTAYRKTGGIMVKMIKDDVLYPSNYRIPYMERLGQNKLLKGTIAVSFLYLFYDVADDDTLMYDFFIKDRAGNISNTESTTEISLSHNDIYQE